MLRFTGSAAPPSLDSAAFALTASRAEAQRCLVEVFLEMWEAEGGCSTHRVRCRAGARVLAGTRANIGATTAHGVHAIVTILLQDEGTVACSTIYRGWFIGARWETMQKRRASVVTACGLVEDAVAGYKQFKHAGAA